MAPTSSHSSSSHILLLPRPFSWRIQSHGKAEICPGSRCFAIADPDMLPTFCVSFALFPAGLLCRTGCREEGGEGGRATHASSSAPYMNEMCNIPAPEQPYHSNLRSSPHNLVHSMRCGAFSEVYMRNCLRPRRPLSLSVHV